MSIQTERHGDTMQHEAKDLAAHFLFVSHSAEMAARTATPGRRARIYAQVMRDNGFGELNMTEVRRLVGD